METYAFTSEQTKQLIAYVCEQYGDDLEFLWENFPRDAVWRHQENQKWYALLMAVPKNKLGFDSDEIVEVLDLRFPKGEALDFALSNRNVLPGYHMNKRNWITIVLDGSMAIGEVIELLDQSYQLTLKR